MTDQEIAEIRGRAERTTPAPWRAENGGLYVPNEWDGNLLEADDDGLNPKFCEEEDAQFCAHAREDVPALLAELARLTDEIERLQVSRTESDTAWATVNEELHSENARLARELGAAKGDFADYVHGGHEKCAYCEHDDECEPGESLCYGNVNGWEWRGN